MGMVSVVLLKVHIDCHWSINQVVVVNQKPVHLYRCFK